MVSLIFIEYPIELVLICVRENLWLGYSSHV